MVFQDVFVFTFFFLQSPAVDGLLNDSNVSADNNNSSNTDTRKPCVLLPKNSDDNQGSLLDRKDEVQRLLSKVRFLNGERA